MAGRGGELARSGAGAIMLLVMMLVASLGLWVGVPLGALYAASKVQEATGSIGAALGVGLLAGIALIVLFVVLLGRLDARRNVLREGRGLDAHGSVAVEGMLVVSALVAVVAFAAWFFLISGSSPIPFYPG